MDRMKLVLTAALVGGLATATVAFSGCTTILGDFEVTSDALGGDAGTRANGEACGAGGECRTGFCVDGVCCDTACNGVCESCAAPVKGTCSPVPANTDPDQECKPEARPDAGVSDASAEAGIEINVPDGGALASDDAPCAGSCNGARACAYPGKEKVCGSEFCNTPSQAAAFTCDAKGRCDIGFTECGNFACEGTSCLKGCTAPDDCGPESVCKSGVCQPKLANGVLCTTGAECASGFCTDGVCCNSQCNDIPGGTCAKPGAVGKCSCSKNCELGCRLFYVDGDGDGHAATNAAPVGPTGDPIIFCVGDAVPPNAADKRDDCNDAEPRAFPGQTEFFDTAAVGGGYDFNCDGVPTPRYGVHTRTGGACILCSLEDGIRGPFCAESKDCNKVTQGQRAALTCTLSSVKGNTQCLPDDTAGFVTNVTCGGTGTFVNCGSCNAGVIGFTRDDARKQSCR